ncbi:MAG: terminase large subunit [Bauldia sp.]|nr:terminase large subunit [Bauldia sp.]
MVASEDPVTAYARAVAAGEVVAGPYVRAACARHLRDLDEGAARGLHWDVSLAQRAIGFFRKVLSVEVEEQDADGAVTSRSVPFELQPWQAFIVGSLFGWRNAAGFRRFRRAYVEVAKGNGKSPLAAGIGHYMFAALKKVRPEVYAAATDRDQAEILFRDAVSMFENSKALRARMVASGDKPVTALRIRNRVTGRLDGFFRPISSDKKGKSGIRPYCALVDEVHEHPDNSVIEMLRAGTKGNQEALIFEITNSGFDKKSVCGQEHDYSIEVVTGVVDNDAWFAFIASVDDDDEPFEDESCWIKANPNLGVSIQPTYIREQVQEARGMPSKEGLVRRLHFCQWTGSDSAAIPRELWTAAQKEFDAGALTERDVPCYGGLDLSRTRDLCAFTLTWLLDQRKDAWRFASRTWFWTPRDTLADRARTDRAPYETWASQGHLEAVPGPRVSYRWVASALAELVARYAPVQIGCDQYGLEQLQDQLDEIGVALPCVVHPQGFNRRKIGEREDSPADDSGAEAIVLWMPDSINKLEAALLEHRLEVFPNPVMTMCAASVVYAENRTGHRMFNKEKATHRIDGMVSLAMSIGVATVNADSGAIASPWNDPTFSMVAA